MLPSSLHTPRNDVHFYCIYHNGFSHKTDDSRTRETPLPNLMAMRFNTCSSTFQDEQSDFKSHLSLRPGMQGAQEKLSGNTEVAALIPSHYPKPPFIFCLFVFSSPGNLMESHTTFPRKRMTFITPFCSCKQRAYLEIFPSSCHRQLLRLLSSESTPVLVVSGARETRI